jgi:transcriptional regulator with XRE-family HTH domain
MTLAEYLKTQNLTADAFAGASGLTPSCLSRYLSGKRTPTLASAALIMVASKGAVDFHDHLDKALARKVKAVRQ